MVNNQSGSSSNNNKPVETSKWNIFISLIPFIVVATATRSNGHDDIDINKTNDEPTKKKEKQNNKFFNNCEI